MDSMQVTVVLIDDDLDVREAVGRLLRSAGWNAELFASAGEFLARQPIKGTGCILLDICMPEMTGPQLHDRMRDQNMSWPVIYLSGHCDIAASVKAMKYGALDVLEKPADADTLLQAVSDAVERHRQLRRRCDQDDEIKSRLATLSAREREVMDQVILGRLNKQIAGTLGIAEKTVKVHRGRAMAKMKVRSVAELVHLCDQISMGPLDRRMEEPRQQFPATVASWRSAPA